MLCRTEVNWDHRKWLIPAIYCTLIDSGSITGNKSSSRWCCVKYEEMPHTVVLFISELELEHGGCSGGMPGVVFGDRLSKLMRGILWWDLSLNKPIYCSHECLPWIYKAVEENGPTWCCDILELSHLQHHWLHHSLSLLLLWGWLKELYLFDHLFVQAFM